MTVSTTTSKISYIGTGLAAALSVPFPFFDSSDLIVIQRTLATGAESILALGPDYTVAGGDGGSGTVTVVDVAKFQTTHQWTIQRIIPRTQLTDLVNNQSLQAETLEQDFDRAVIRDQEVEEKITRSLRVPISDPQTEAQLQLPASVNRANKVLAFDASGNPIATLVSSTTIVVTAFMETVLDDVDAPSARATLDAAAKESVADESLGGTRRLKAIAGSVALLEIDAQQASNVYDKKRIESHPSSSGLQDKFRMAKERASGSPLIVTLDWSDALGGEIAHSGVPFPKNRLVNGAFDVWQLGTSFTSSNEAVTGTPGNNNGKYTSDQWILVSNGDNIVNVAKETTIVPAQSVASAKLTCVTANTKAGLLQILEGDRTRDFVRYGLASMAISARTITSEVRRIALMILGWTGTVDAPVYAGASLFSAWGAQGVQPTPAANWSVLGWVVISADLTSTFTRYVLENIAVGSTVKNLAFLVHVDDTDMAVNDDLYLGNAILNPGPVASFPSYRSLREEIQDCQRYLCKTYNLSVVPGTDETGAFRGTLMGAGGVAGMVPDTYWSFPVRMRGNPTVLTFQPNAANTQNLWSVGTAATAVNIGEGAVSIQGAASASSAGIHVVAHARF